MLKLINARLADRTDLDELRFKFGVKFDMNLFNGKSTEHKLKANDKEKTISQNKSMKISLYNCETI